MTMTIDTTQQRFGHPMNFDYTPTTSQAPAFSNPWSSATPSQAQGAGSMFVPNQQAPLPHPRVARPGTNAPSSSTIPPYGSLPVGTAGADLMSLNRMQSSSAGYSEPSYASSASPVNGQFAPSSAPSYDAMGYAPAPLRHSAYNVSPESDAARRYSHASIEHERKGFADALDASHGMLAMSQETPRNIYGPRNDRSSVDSYGFPSAHSTSSSISSASNFGSYYGDSVSDYSTAGSDYESANSRTLPRPQSLIGAQIPPAPQTMMGQFSSKVSSSTQKKHKCKVCDKRFTRPSSLQTHMYSHTGEKPFACEVEGCGRQFSVVSNLRRHRKVHRGDAVSEVGSEDHQSDE